MNKILLPALSLILLVANFAKAEVLDRVVGSIDGSPVNQSEIMAELKKISPTAKFEYPIKGDNLKAGITSLLLEKEARQLGIAVSQEELDQQLQGVISREGISREQFESSLSHAGITIGQYKDKLALELNRNRVVATVLKSRIQVTDEELRSYTDSQNQDSIEDSGKFGLLKLFLNTGGSNLEIVNLETESSKIKEFLQGGGICQSYKSENIKKCEFLGIFELKDLREEYATLVSKIEEYSFSSEFNEDGERIVLVKVSKDVDSKQSLVKQNLRDKLFEEKFKVEAEKYLNQELFDKYLVDLH